MAKAQVGFIENLVQPAFETLQMMLPNAVYNLRNMELNKEHWANLEDEYAFI